MGLVGRSCRDAETGEAVEFEIGFRTFEAPIDAG
jgi:hypothetical protein